MTLMRGASCASGADSSVRMMSGRKLKPAPLRCGLSGNLRRREPPRIPPQRGARQLEGMKLATWEMADWALFGRNSWGAGRRHAAARRQKQADDLREWARARDAALRMPRGGPRAPSGPRLCRTQKEKVPRDERCRVLAIPPPPRPDKCPACALRGKIRDDQNHFIGLEEDGLLRENTARRGRAPSVPSSTYT